MALMLLSGCASTNNFDYSKNMQSTGMVLSTNGVGAGIFIGNVGDKAYFLTCHHVIDKSPLVTFAERIDIDITTVLFEYPVKVIKTDAKNDLALLECELKYHTKPYILYNGKKLPVGTDVYSYGYPFSRPLTLSRGYIASYDDDIIIVHAETARGYSGGPVFDQNSNQLIGVVSSMFQPNNNMAKIISHRAISKFLKGTPVEKHGQ
jgi:serine protease Do